MNNVEQSTYDKAFKPFDVVTLVDRGNDFVGFINETNINDCQDGFDNQVSYSITWIVKNDNMHSAWFRHNELTRHCNVMFEVAKEMTNGHGRSQYQYSKLMGDIA